MRVVVGMTREESQVEPGRESRTMMLVRVAWAGRWGRRRERVARTRPPPGVGFRVMIG
jgi:hypothetical protein